MNLLPLATILVDPQTALIAGAIIPVLMAKLIRLQPELESAKAVKLGAAWGAGYCVSVSYMYFTYSDWMFGYMLDTKDFPLVAFWPVFFGACAFSGAAAAAVGAYFVRTDRLPLAVLCVLGAVTALAVVWIPHWHSYSHIGTFAEYRAGTASPLPGTGTAPIGLNAAGALIAIPSVVMIVNIIRRSMKL